MELIPIIQESLLFFIAVLGIVLTVSYLLFKFNNKKDEQEVLQRQVVKSEYSNFLNEQTYTHPVKYIENVPQYNQSWETINRTPERIQSEKNAGRLSRYVILNETNQEYQFYKPNVREFSSNFDKVNLRQY